jgi:hypothetical protein
MRTKRPDQLGGLIHWFRLGVDGLLRDKTRPPGKARLAADIITRIVELTLVEAQLTYALRVTRLPQIPSKGFK